MDRKIISITIWGKENGKWIEWYNDIKELMNSMGYQNTHIGIMSEHYTSGKIMTVKRKEAEIISMIDEGEVPLSFSCYSLPKGYKVASFDYDFMCERNGSYFSVIVKSADFNDDIAQKIIELMKRYINMEDGEIFSTSASEMPLLYAETKDKSNLKSYKLLLKI